MGGLGNLGSVPGENKGWGNATDHNECATGHGPAHRTDSATSQASSNNDSLYSEVGSQVIYFWFQKHPSQISSAKCTLDERVQYV
jgi:hypothetical protein